MLKNDWFNKFDSNKDKIRSLIQNYHPVLLRGGNSLPITAPNAEMACNNVRNMILNEYKGNPLEDFDSAAKNRDFNKLYSLMNSTWFGVPESTSCWGIEGFSEAVELLEDPVEEEEEE